MADEPRLSERAEQLLASLPIPERDWAEQARAIEARLSATAPGSTETRWLDAPLPEEAPLPTSNTEAVVEPAGNPTDTPFPFDSMPSMIEAPASTPEGAAVPAAAAEEAAPALVPDPVAAPVPAAATATPVPNAGSSQSLSALARSVAQKSGRPQSRDIARESLSVAAAARSHSDAMAERVRSARPTPPPPPSQRPTQPALAPQPALVAAPPANNNQLGPWIAVGGLSLVAAVALWVIARPTAPTVLQTSPEAPAIAARAEPRQVEAAPVAADRAKDTSEAAVPVAPAPVSEGALAPSMAASALPLAQSKLAVAPAAPRVGGEVAPGAAQRTTAPASGLAASDRPVPESIVLEDTPASGKLAGSKAGAAAPQGAASGLRPAAGAPSGGLPDRPSTGAVQAAVGSVMGAARACVAGGAATPAQVTFGSSGTVQTVNVTGPNSGTPSASCIDAALRRARVAPFASPTFSLMVWVRP